MREPKIGEVVVGSGRRWLITGATKGGWLTVDLDATVEISAHALRNSSAELTSLEEVLKPGVDAASCPA